jgi:Penicillin-insensitive murein endopeptidase
MVRLPSHADSRARWALPGLLSVLDRASRIVGRKFPGSVLEIGELSGRNGGRIASHLSHQSGRDADVGFYVVDLDGQPVRAPRYLRFEGSGECRDDPTMRFDEERNWAFVRAVLQDPRYNVRQIFIYAPLRARLLAYAAKIEAPLEIRTRAAAAMMQPVNAQPHDDHFHIRISCPLEQIDQGCVDLPLWHAPGSPDEFGPDLLAGAPKIPGGLPDAVPPEAWGRLSKLWSIERGVCTRGEPTCADRNEGPMCEDPGIFGITTLALVPDEMGTPEPTANVATPERAFCAIEPTTSESNVSALVDAPDVSLPGTLEGTLVSDGLSCSMVACVSYLADDEPNTCPPSRAIVPGRPHFAMK